MGSTSDRRRHTGAEEAALTLKILVDPLARGAYFGDLLDVARAELRTVLGDAPVAVDPRATLTFLDVQAPVDAAEELVRLSCVQAIFDSDGEALQLLDLDPGFRLPADLVWGAKYRGKTHELVTQAAIHVALAHAARPVRALLDPMAGRGTTLLWALRFGLDAWGIEQDAAALDHLQRHVKRQTKRHRLKHTLRRGGRKEGAFLDLRFPDVGRLRLITGDSRHADRLVQSKRFELVVSDLPYGVQFTGPSGTRNPLKVLTACAPVWAERLQPGGAMVLVYNRLQPTREQLAAPFVAAGLQLAPFEAPHRMSESILRDFLVLTRP